MSGDGRWRDEEGRIADASGHMDASNVLAYLLAGPLTFGGMGWLSDRWLHTSFLLPIGSIVGVGLSLYLIWVRYGKEVQPPSAATGDDSTTHRRGETK